MANFAIIRKDGSLHNFNHVCFAWVGDPGRDQWEKVLIRINTSTLSEEDSNLLQSKLDESSLRRERMPIVVHQDYKAFGPCIEVTLDHSQKFSTVLRVLKMVGKVISYTPQLCNALLEFLREGANWQEAQFLTVRNNPTGYNYPFPRYNNKDQCKEYLQGGPMADLTKWDLEQHKAYSPWETFDWGLGEYRGASGACHPCTMTSHNNHLIQAKTLKDLREEFEYE